jgi:Lon protease-like protein
MPTPDMKHTLPRLEELPDVFPVFPLTGALLLPGGRLPLNIFEPRYLAMTEDALGQGRMFAMVQPDASQKATDRGPALFRVGCLGRLTSFSEADDGRYLITLFGLIRFEIVAEMEMQRGYRRVRGDFRRFAADLHEAAPTDVFDRVGLLEALRGYFARRGFNANWEAIQAMADAPLVTSLSMVCPFDPLEKQALLEAPGFAERAQTLRTLLRIDTHEPPANPDPDATPPRRMAS